MIELRRGWQQFNYLQLLADSREALKLSNTGLLLSRAWYYFRLGYSTYLTFILGYVSTLITVYYLAIKNVPSLLDIFPKFVPFAILATIVGVPLSVAVGWIHLKRSNLYSSEATISVEANPWNYKLPPGYTRDAFYPTILAQLRILNKLAQKESIISDSEKDEIARLETKLQTLLDGGFLGTPRRKMDY